MQVFRVFPIIPGEENNKISEMNQEVELKVLYEAEAIPLRVGIISPSSEDGI